MIYVTKVFVINDGSKDRTLEEADVSGAMKKILNGLESLGIELRG